MGVCDGIQLGKSGQVEEETDESKREMAKENKKGNQSTDQLASYTPQRREQK
jgi:hypothetical protein